MSENNYDTSQTAHYSVPERHDVMIQLSEDGFARMTFKALMKMPLYHLISIKETEAFVPPHIQMFGYSEWVSMTLPVISIGWDWELSHDDQSIKIERIGLPRSNLMLMDYVQCDLGLDHTLHLIGQKVDATAWEVTVKDQILKSQIYDHMTLSYS
jgi:hypothetical protein